MEAPQLRPLAVGEILDVSLKLSAKNAAQLVKIVLFVVAPAQVLTNLIEVSANPDFRPGVFVHSSGSGGETGTIAAATIASLLISFLAGQLATAASFKAIADAYLGARPTWRGSLAFAAKRFHSVLWIVVLGGLIVGVGFVFLIVPGVYLIVAFTVAVPVLLSEGKRGRHALRRSRELVSGRWWKVLLLVAAGGLLVGIVSGGIEAVLVSILLFGSSNRLVVFIVSTIAGIAASVISTPFKAAYTTVLYFDLRVRKEAFDLQILAETLGIEPPAQASDIFAHRLPPGYRPPE